MKPEGDGNGTQAKASVAGKKRFAGSTGGGRKPETRVSAERRSTAPGRSVRTKRAQGRKPGRSADQRAAKPKEDNPAKGCLRSYRDPWAFLFPAPLLLVRQSPEICLRNLLADVSHLPEWPLFTQELPRRCQQLIFKPFIELFLGDPDGDRRIVALFAARADVNTAVLFGSIRADRGISKRLPVF